MRDFRGRPVIVTFLYTNCDETCPPQAQQIKGALDQLEEDVPALAIAVDPANDTPERARAFLTEQRMTGRMEFVVGDEEELRAAVERLRGPAPASWMRSTRRESCSWTPRASSVSRSRWGRPRPSGSRTTSRRFSPARSHVVRWLEARASQTYL